MGAELSIWNNVPYNTGKSKLYDLDIHPEYNMTDIYRKHPGILDASSLYAEDMSGNDTMVYREEIVNPNRPAKETYDDVPILIPYIVPGSDRCIITCPGGGYLSKSMEGEGTEIAEFLNAAGISCFVLWYRSYPYRAPVMYRDCQRAIRYVRYHAEQYDINPDNIGIMGFSAGGNLCGTTVEIFRNSPVVAEGYTPDEIDAVSAEVKLMGLIYPVVSFEESTAFLTSMENEKTVRDQEKREEAAKYYTLKNHIKAGDPATFLCCAADDIITPCVQVCDYANTLKKHGVPFEIHVFAHGGHGFGACKPEQTGMIQHDRKRTMCWCDMFTAWANHLFDGVEEENPYAAFIE